jgi:chorismate synthase
MFRVTTFGESHGGGVGCVVDGVPPKLQLTREELQFELDRRRPGQSRITTPRNEEDSCEILSGVGLDGITLGTPIAVLVRNKDHRSQDYGEIAVAYRPSHADATYDMKYGVRAIAGGGRSSARETIGRVAAGAIAKKILAQIAGTEILAYVSQVKDVTASGVDHATFTMEDVEGNIARCPDQASADAMIEAIDKVRVKGDSCGGVVTCIVRGCPRGLGAPVFDKLEADLAKAMLSLPATKGFEVGSGFDGVNTTGSEHNDEFYMDPKTGIRTKDQPERRDPGRDLQRRDHRAQDCVQAHEHHHPAAEHREQGRRGRRAQGEGTARSVRRAQGGAHGGEHGCARTRGPSHDAVRAVQPAGTGGLQRPGPGTNADSVRPGVHRG